MTKVQLAKQYRTEYGAEVQARVLARIMYKENKAMFKDEEAARYALRNIEGKTGKNWSNQNLAYKMDKARPSNPYGLPKSHATKFEPYYIVGPGKGLIINDIHLPFQDNAAITACLDFAKKEKPDFILLNGDVLDFYQLSYFMKDPREPKWAEELEMYQEFIVMLQTVFPNANIFFKFGNHEERYDNYMLSKAPDLVGIKEFSLENIIKSRAPEVEVIASRRIVMLNSLPFIHGHEFGRQIFSPVNAARGLMLKAKHAAVKADCHNTSQHPTKDIMGKVMITYSVGCLCSLTPKWLPLNEWNHGFAMIDLDANEKTYRFRNYSIYEDDKGVKQVV